MRKIRFEKLVLNIGVGEPGDKLEEAYNLLKKISGAKPVKITSKNRVPTWGVRPGVEIGVKVTLRDEEKIKELLKNLLTAVEGEMKKSCFDNRGNISFGIDEYIHIPGLKYDPKIPLFGLNVCITLERKGYRIRRRRLNKKKIPSNQVINKEESIKFIKSNYGVEIR